MTVAIPPRNRYLDRPSPPAPADVIDTILDKGLVIDIYVRGPVTTADFMTVGRTASASKNSGRRTRAVTNFRTS